MNALKKLTLVAKILLAAVLVCTFAAMIVALVLPGDEIDVVYRLPQTLFGFYSIYAILSAFVWSGAFWIFFGLYALLLLTLFLPPVFLSKLRRRYIAYAAAFILSTLCVIDIWILSKIAGAPVAPIVTDAVTILCALVVLVTDIFLNKRKKLSKKS